MIFSPEQITNFLAFPRPDFRRRYLLLDGKWRLKVCSSDRSAQRVIHNSNFSDADEIMVPFCLESAASGIGRTCSSWNVLYQTTFRIPPDLAAVSYLLHVGAVDHDCHIYLNGKFQAANYCGYNQITIPLCGECLISGENSLIVHVKDSRSSKYLRGKQTIFRNNRFVFYTPTTGIWQSVWLEPVGAHYLTSYRVTNAQDSWIVELEFAASPPHFELDLEVNGEAYHYGQSSFKLLPSYPKGCPRFGLKLSPALFGESQVLWHPDNPALHPMLVTTFAETAEGLKKCDEVATQIGVRTIRVDHERLYLNDAPFYQRLVLHQGYYPEGWYRPRNKLMYLDDLYLIKAAGFNGVRMHQKVEDPAFLFCADALGIAVWGEFPSCYWLNRQAQWELKFLLKRTVERDFNHPSILTWVIFNESWGLFHAFKRQHFRRVLEDFYYFLQTLDPTRPIIDNSGFYHAQTDILDVHYYADSIKNLHNYLNNLDNRALTRFTLRAFLSFLRTPYREPQPELYDQWFEDTGQPIILSEFGGYGFYATDRLSLAELYRAWMEELARHPKLAGFCYTQFTDVEHEQNGLFTLDRQPKLALTQLAELTKLPCPDE